MTSNYPVNVTASYSGTLGGGNWYYSSSNISVSPIYSTQSFSYTESSDIDVNITNIIKAWYSGKLFLLHPPWLNQMKIMEGYDLHAILSSHSFPMSFLR